MTNLFDEEEHVLMGFDKDGYAIPENYTSEEPSYGLQFADNADDPPAQVSFLQK